MNNYNSFLKKIHEEKISRNKNSNQKTNNLNNTKTKNEIIKDNEPIVLNVNKNISEIKDILENHLGKKLKKIKRHKLKQRIKETKKKNHIQNNSKKLTNLVHDNSNLIDINPKITYNNQLKNKKINIKSYEKRCRICYDDDKQEKLINPCKCDGSIKFVHQSCLEKWIETSKRDDCPQCKYKYIKKKICNYPKLEFLTINRNIKIISLITLFVSVILCSYIKNKIDKFYGKTNLNKSNVYFLFEGLKLLIILSMIIVPILHYKNIINANEILDELMRNPYFMASNTYEVTTFIYIVYFKLLKKLIDSYIKFEFTFENYRINLN